MADAQLRLAADHKGRIKQEVVSTGDAALQRIFHRHQSERDITPFYRVENFIQRIIRHAFGRFPEVAEGGFLGVSARLTLESDGHTLDFLAGVDYLPVDIFDIAGADFPVAGEAAHVL